MKYSYRITKYKKTNKVNNRNEWTSFYDIGGLISYEEYIKVEKDYINTVLGLCKCFNVSSVIVEELEIYSDVCFYVEGQVVPITKLEVLLRKILREDIWCKLKNEKCEFHFGYDYYMYFISKENRKKCVEKTSFNLNIEEFKSPYM